MDDQRGVASRCSLIAMLARINHATQTATAALMAGWGE